MVTHLRLISAAITLFGICTAAFAEDKVTFALSWIPGGNHFGVIAANAEGFYREAGIEADIQRGYGSGDTVKRVGTGIADIGVADAAAVTDGVGNSLKVKQVAAIFERAPDCIFFVSNRGIAAPADLEGKNVAQPLARLHSTACLCSPGTPTSTCTRSQSSTWRHPPNTRA